MPNQISATLPIAYGICLLLSLVLLGCYIAFVKEKNSWMRLMLISVCVVNLGYFYLSLSPNLFHALMANRIAYLGNVFQPLFMLLVIANICRIEIKKPFAIFSFAVATVMLISACTPGILPIFYKTVKYTVVDGAVELIKTYSFTHSIYTVYVVSYMLAVIGMTAYAILKKKLVFYRYIIMMVLIAFTNVAVWLTERFLGGSFEFLSVSYIFTCLLMIMLYSELSENGLKDSFNSVISPNTSNSNQPNVLKLQGVEIDFSDKETLSRICNYYSANRILTNRETEILALTLQRFSRKEIAKQLFITDNTVKTHTSNLYFKLNVSSREELVTKITGEFKAHI